MLKEAILIAGPTASGKSALALRMAADHDAIIVNTDSMQVYSVLRVLTARPGPDELAKAPHRLYGHVPPNEPYSTGNWVRDVEELIEAEGLRGKRVIFVGGTGLYFRALTQGLAPIPDVHEEVRTYWRSRLADEGEEALHRLLAEVDPVSASRIRPSDGQRILRALEVHETSGKPISYWQAQSSLPLVDLPSARKIVLMPERAALAGRIERRFDQMMQSGAIEEVEELLAFDLPPSMPAMKAIGVREIATAMAGEISLEEAASRAKAATRQYAKRQMTWFRHQLGEDWERMAV
ncbi:tRNA (adenosine(37)-N6)-dimethylallyltransferase MiaA [Chelativorans sp. J32]|uniref:tRNA (adenosine(37)-N6)-dimethylallyltransferase MiaA n=1 Tax=Chelativorans sp. J32 TaxID=935840 RepID=UPI000481AECB|nr:tRNA (adenosine(37)-N6)-dimethylallyltransferase MiaA [Chelativorans sp. J32]